MGAETPKEALKGGRRLLAELMWVTHLLECHIMTGNLLVPPMNRKLRKGKL